MKPPPSAAELASYRTPRRLPRHDWLILWAVMSPAVSILLFAAVVAVLVYNGAFL